ncbi:hypothetical protein D3C87_1252720 [compost metagenome]
MKLAVVVVFDDPCLMPGGPFDQGEPTIQRQRRAGGELMRRRQEDGSGLARFGHYLFYNEALSINPDGNALQSRCIEGFARAIVSRVFDEYPITRIKQHIGAE